MILPSNSALSTASLILFISANVFFSFVFSFVILPNLNLNLYNIISHDCYFCLQLFLALSRASNLIGISNADKNIMKELWIKKVAFIH